MTKLDRANLRIIELQAEKDKLCVEFILKLNNINEELKMLRVEKDNLKAYGDMADCQWG